MGQGLPAGSPFGADPIYATAAQGAEADALSAVLNPSTRILSDQFGEPAINFASDTQSDYNSILKVDADYGWVTVQNSTLYGDSGGGHVWNIGADGSFSFAQGGFAIDDYGDLTTYGNASFEYGTIVLGAGYNDYTAAYIGLGGEASFAYGALTIDGSGNLFLTGGGSIQGYNGEVIDSNGKFYYNDPNESPLTDIEGRSGRLLYPNYLGVLVDGDGTLYYSNGNGVLADGSGNLYFGGAGNFRFADSNSIIYPIQAPTSEAPSYALGGLYFDTTLNKLRVGGATGWETVTSV